MSQAPGSGASPSDELPAEEVVVGGAVPAEELVSEDAVPAEEVIAEDAAPLEDIEEIAEVAEEAAAPGVPVAPAELESAATDEPREGKSKRSKSRERRAADKAAGDDGFGRVIDAIADLLQFVVDWLRQEAEALMHDKVVIPLQKLGLTLASGCAAAALAALGIGFIAVGVFMLLGQWLTYPGALLLIGGVLVLGAVVFTVIKMRSMQK